MPGTNTAYLLDMLKEAENKESWLETEHLPADLSLHCRTDMHKNVRKRDQLQ
jgi:hypothetical protein